MGFEHGGTGFVSESLGLASEFGSFSIDAHGFVRNGQVHDFETLVSGAEEAGPTHVGVGHASSLRFYIPASIPRVRRCVLFIIGLPS